MIDDIPAISFLIECQNNNSSSSESLIDFVEDRPGHDFRYSLNTDGIQELGWVLEYRFESAMRETIRWYIGNAWWWKALWKTVSG